MIVIFYLFICLSLSCLASSVFGQAINEKLFFSTIDEDITPIVVQMLEDRQGYIWFSTTAGLYRYDSTDMKAYKPDSQDPNSISVHPEYIAEAPDGKIWLSTLGGGLNCLDPMTQQVEHYLFDPKDTTSISGNIPKYLTVDRTGLVWVGFDNETGLNQFDPSTRKSRRFRVKSGQTGHLQGRVLGNIIADGDRIYLATTAGFEYYDKSTDTFHFFPLMDQNGDTIHYRLSTICKAKDGAIWMDLPGSGIRRYDPTTDSTSILHIQTKNGRRNPNPKISWRIKMADCGWLALRSYGLYRPIGRYCKSTMSGI